MTFRFALFVGLLAFASLAPQVGRADDLKVLSANVFTGVLDGAFAEFESASGKKVVFEYVTAGKVRDRVRAGEAGDVAIATRGMLDDLDKNGKIVGGTVVDLARSAVALVIKKGAKRPDIGSLEAFKRSLLALNSVSYPNPAGGGLTGILIAGDLDRLGIAGEIKAKTKFPPPGHFSVELVASGEADAAIAQPMEAMLQPGVEIVGLLPPELQSPKDFTFAAGVMTTAKEPEAARALVKVLTGASVQSVLREKGMEPESGR